MVIGKTVISRNDVKETEKRYTKEYKLAVAKRSQKVEVLAVTTNGTQINGFVYMPKDVRPSDYLRNVEIKRILLVDARIEGVQCRPIMVIVDNCQYITLLDDHDAMVEDVQEYFGTAIK
jgi:hypothetical protein